MTVMTKSKVELIKADQRNMKKEMTFKEAIRLGLLVKESKSIPCTFLYDTKGSQLFEDITELEEYYPTRCELQILQQRSTEIVGAVRDKGQDDIVIVELGSGSSTKTRTLLRSFLSHFASVIYVPIEISESILKESCDALSKEFPELHVIGFNGLYEQGLQYVEEKYRDHPKLVCFLGGSIGNFTPDDAGKFLKELNQMMAPQDQLLVGIDLHKDSETLERAYNDSRGVTAEFNLNLLHRMNAELGAHFNAENFEHTSIYNVEQGRIEMWLRSLVNQQVRIGQLNATVELKKGEMIHTENSYKYRREQINRLADVSNFNVKHLWLDDNEMFTLSLFSVCHNN